MLSVIVMGQYLQNYAHANLLRILHTELIFPLASGIKMTHFIKLNLQKPALKKLIQIK